MKGCKVCGFPLEYRPGLKHENGICLACINAEVKKTIDFKKRQEWLTEYIKENKPRKEQYDCIIGVSGGKDSYMIVKRLMDNHGITNPLLVTLLDEFEQTEAGKYNLRNIAETFDADHIYFRSKPKTTKKEMLTFLESELNCLKKVDDDMCGFDGVATKLAKQFGIKMVFYGENAAFEYGDSKDLEIFHPASTDEVKYIYLGAIYPYSIMDSLEVARSAGFKDLDDFQEWDRQGTGENYTQIDSVGYIAHRWCKFVKFGAQRCADVASRLAREGILTREQALLYINEEDHKLDPRSKRSVCNTLDISEDEFDKIVDKNANLDIVKKDANGVYRRKEKII